MYEAFFSDVLQVILILLLIYFGFKIIIRLFGPLILKFILKKVGQRFEKKFHGYQQNPNANKKEGEVTIEKKPKNKRRKFNNEVGEYVDYEEVD